MGTVVNVAATFVSIRGYAACRPDIRRVLRPRASCNLPRTTHLPTILPVLSVNLGKVTTNKNRSKHSKT